MGRIGVLVTWWETLDPARSETLLLCSFNYENKWTFFWVCFEKTVSLRNLWLGAEWVAFSCIPAVPHSSMHSPHPTDGPTWDSQAKSRQDPDRGHCAGLSWWSRLVYSRQFCLVCFFHCGIVTLSRPLGLLLSHLYSHNPVTASVFSLINLEGRKFPSDWPLGIFMGHFLGLPIDVRGPRSLWAVT